MLETALDDVASLVGLYDEVVKVGGSMLGPVRIAWTIIDPARSTWDAAIAQLGDSQLRRYQTMAGAGRNRFAAGRLLLADLVPPLVTSDAVRLESVCDHCGGDHGRPRVVGAPYAVSVSYTGDLVVAAAVSLDSASAVGIDLEASSGDDAAPMPALTRLFTPRPPPGLRGWTEIEAVVKADGRGVRIDPADIMFGKPSEFVLPGGRAVSVPGRRDAFEVANAPGPPGHIVSVAVASPMRSAPH